MDVVVEVNATAAQLAAASGDGFAKAARKASVRIAIYTMQDPTTNPGILAIISLPRPRPIASGSITAAATQSAIWEVADGKGPLSATQLDLLRNAYAMPETNPMFPKAVTDFRETLSVIGPIG